MSACMEFVGALPSSQRIATNGEQRETKTTIKSRVVPSALRGMAITY